MSSSLEAARSRVQETRDRFLAHGVILAVRLGERVRVSEVARAAARGGLRILEITLTTPGALEVIRELSADPELLVGGGTVLTVEDARAVAQAGGAFALSPVFDAAVVDEAQRLGLLAVPGAGSASEILEAHRHGASLVKVFPAGPLGGPEFLRCVRGPLPDVPLVPTSGPDSSNVAEYLAAGAVAVGVGHEILHEGFTLESVEEAARRMRVAMDRARRSLG